MTISCLVLHQTLSSCQILYPATFALDKGQSLLGMFGGPFFPWAEVDVCFSDFEQVITYCLFLIVSVEGLSWIKFGHPVQRLARSFGRRGKENGIRQLYTP